MKKSIDSPNDLKLYSKTIIYLDLNKWIDLSRAFYGRKGGDPFVDTLKYLQEETVNGNIIIPYSLINFFETTKNSNIERRKRLAEFILDLSDGYTILPFDTSLYKAEIELAVFNKLRYNSITIPLNLVVAKGVEQLVGAKIVLGNVSENAKLKVEEANKKNSTIVWLMVNGYKYFQEARASKADLNQISQLYTSRQQLNSLKEKDQEIALINEMLRDIIYPTLDNLADTGKIERLKFSTLFKIDEDWINFVYTIPTINCLLKLKLESIKNLEVPIEINDQNDLLQLITAIPYCDAVVAEKHWIDQAKRCKLDEIYNCKLLTSVNELLNIQFD